MVADSNDVSMRRPRTGAATSGVQPVQGATLRELAYVELRRALVTGHFAPGESITIAALSGQMGLGVMPVREAVQQLAAQGALEFLANRSVRVPNYNVEELEKIFELRMLLECFAAAKAAELITREQLEHVSGCLRQLERQLSSAPAEDTLQQNYDFHFSIYRASGSSYLVDAIERLWLRIGPLHLSVFQSAVEERREYFSVLPLHFSLIRALKAHNSERAGKIVRQLLMKSLAWYERQVTLNRSAVTKSRQKLERQAAIPGPSKRTRAQLRP